MSRLLMNFESETHLHAGRLSKRELALHLTIPHLRRTGQWSSIATPVSQVAKWSRRELDRTHAEFHDSADR